MTNRALKARQREHRDEQRHQRDEHRRHADRVEAPHALLGGRRGLLERSDVSCNCSASSFTSAAFSDAAA